MTSCNLCNRSKLGRLEMKPKICTLNTLCTSHSTIVQFGSLTSCNSHSCNLQPALPEGLGLPEWKDEQVYSVWRWSGTCIYLELMEVCSFLKQNSIWVTCHMCCGSVGWYLTCSNSNTCVSLWRSYMVSSADVQFSPWGTDDESKDHICFLASAHYICVLILVVTCPTCDGYHVLLVARGITVMVVLLHSFQLS
jgi:hypothetical protein